MRAAQRIAVHPWRDPRLLLGIMLVLLSTVVGAKLFAAQDDTVAYWSVRTSVAAGDAVERGDLVSTRVRLGAPTRGSYVQVKDEFPARISDLVWARDVSAGSLLEGSVLVVDGEQAAGELPLNVASGAYPLDLRSGESVDVWVGPGPGEPAEDKSTLVLRAARVLSTGGGSTAVGGSLARTILVGVADGALADKTLSAISAGHVTLVRVP
ncbi:MAG: hypothetical protein M3Q98_15080 [Actinomycetota bacterium]|nr:hypothetical protein [Actinomycetota bacterium]